MKHSLLFALTASMLTATPAKGLAQEQLYPHHFNLSEVTLLDSPMKQAMDLNIRVLTSRTHHGPVYQLAAAPS